MSAPKVGVWKLSHSTSWWWQCGVGPACPAKRSFGIERTLSAAADAGRAHLARFHTALMPPDPYCSVHESHPAYCVESHDALTDPEPVSTYCRTHGTHSAECGCGSGKSPTGDEGGRESAIQRFASEVQPSVVAALTRMNRAMDYYAISPATQYANTYDTSRSTT